MDNQSDIRGSLQYIQWCRDIGRIDVIDPALLRPGKWGQPMHVPLPNPDERGMILKAICQKRQIDADLDFIALGNDSRLNNFSGADLSDLVRFSKKPNWFFFISTIRWFIGFTDFRSPRFMGMNFSACLLVIREHFLLLTIGWGSCKGLSWTDL